MDLEHLRYFKVVAETEHITRSAERLHISQPSLSKAIGNVEELVGTKLFIREKSKIRLNDAGKLFLADLTKFLGTLDQAKAEILRDFSLETGLLRVSASIGSGILTDYFSKLYHQYPKMRMVQNVEPEPVIQQKLLSGAIDMGITTAALSESIPQITSKLLLRDEMLVLIPQDHPLANRTSVTLQELAAERLIINNGGVPIRGSHPNIVLECNAPELIGAMFSEDGCLGLIPMSAHYRMNLSARANPSMCHRAIPIADGVFSRSFYLNYAPERQCSQIASFVLDDLPKWFSSVSAQYTEV